MVPGLKENLWGSQAYRSSHLYAEINHTDLWLLHINMQCQNSTSMTPIRTWRKEWSKNFLPKLAFSYKGSTVLYVDTMKCSWRKWQRKNFYLRDYWENNGKRTKGKKRRYLMTELTVKWLWILEKPETFNIFCPDNVKWYYFFKIGGERGDVVEQQRKHISN